jgi:hypothetical protein
VLTRPTLSKILLIVLLITGVIKAQASRNGAYWRESCSQYVSRISGIDTEMAMDMWQGRELVVVGEYDDLAQALRIQPMREGMVVAFNGSHVAVYHGGQLMDSDPKHGGVGLLQYEKRDSWFSGKVRILVPPTESQE